MERCLAEGFTVEDCFIAMVCPDTGEIDMARWDLDDVGL